MQVISQFWWVIGATCGALFGQFIPKNIKGFEFALTAMFITLYVDAFQHKKDFKLLTFAVFSALLAFITETYIYPESFLIIGIACYIILITLSHFKSRSKQRSNLS